MIIPNLKNEMLDQLFALLNAKFLNANEMPGESRSENEAHQKEEAIRKMKVALEHAEKIINYPPSHWHIFNPQQGGFDGTLIKSAMASAKEANI